MVKFKGCFFGWGILREVGDGRGGKQKVLVQRREKEDVEEGEKGEEGEAKKGEGRKEGKTRGEKGKSTLHCTALARRKFEPRKESQTGSSCPPTAPLTIEPSRSNSLNLRDGKVHNCRQCT